MREYSWVVGVPRAARANELRRVHREVQRRGQAAVAHDGPALERVCEVQRAYEMMAAGGADQPDARWVVPRRAEPVYQDVAIDFPSVSRIVERLGRGLMEAEDDPCVAHVCLSWHQAREGAQVALEVPVRCTCLVCGGRGEVWAEWCSMCRGTGSAPHRHLVRLSIPPGVRPGARFQFTVNPPYAPETSVEVRITIA